jgi:hypothetical protein
MFVIVANDRLVFNGFRAGKTVVFSQPTMCLQAFMFSSYDVALESLADITKYSSYKLEVKRADELQLIIA